MPSRQSFRSKAFWGGLIAGGIAGYKIGRTWISEARLRPLHRWQQDARRRYSKAQLNTWTAAARSRLRQLIAGDPTPCNPWHPDPLPGLALYQTLQDAGLSSETARTEVAALVRTGLSTQRRLSTVLARLPDPYPLFCRLVQLNLQWGGGTWEWLQRDDRCFAFRSTTCPAHEAFTRAGVPELTQVYCRMDDWVAEYFPPGIQWKRTQTLGSGGEYCDFYYCRSKEP